MVGYLIKSSACLALFLLFYTLFLEREKMHTLKRFYLLSGIVLALVIPLITITHYVDVPTIRVSETQFVTFTSSIGEGKKNIGGLLWLFYGIGVLFTGAKFTTNLLGIARKIHQNPKSREQGLIRVMLQETIIPHTFFNYIFLNIRQFLTHRIPREVWLHEVTHARQKHSIDVVFLELLQVAFWFNPLIYSFKRKIKINHEFLADEGVLKHEVDPVHYQTTLLQYASYGNQPQVANAFNYSSIKKRIKIMKRTTSKNSIRLRALLVLPLLAGAMYSFSNKVEVPRISDAERVISLVPLQEKATPEMVAEYNALAKKYNEMSPTNFHVKKGEVERLRYIYGLMTDAQKSDADPFPEFPEPPTAPRVLRGEISDIPPPPPPPGPAEITAHPSINGALVTTLATGTAPAIAATSPTNATPAVLPEIAEMPHPPTSPPPPPNPVEHMKELAKTGAEFYYNDKRIPADKALEMVNNNSNLYIHILKGNTGTPVVKLTDSQVKM